MHVVDPGGEQLGSCHDLLLALGEAVDTRLLLTGRVGGGHWGRLLRAAVRRQTSAHELWITWGAVYDVLEERGACYV
ncbi:hypothetical protein GCM10027615_76830 [Plantactinospora veratri]